MLLLLKLVIEGVLCRWFLKANQYYGSLPFLSSEEAIIAVNTPQNWSVLREV